MNTCIISRAGGKINVALTCERVATILGAKSTLRTANYNISQDGQIFVYKTGLDRVEFDLALDVFLSADCPTLHSVVRLREALQPGEELVVLYQGTTGFLCNHKTTRKISGADVFVCGLDADLNGFFSQKLNDKPLTIASAANIFEMARKVVQQRVVGRDSGAAVLDVIYSQEFGWVTL